MAFDRHAPQDTPRSLGRLARLAKTEARYGRA